MLIKPEVQTQEETVTQTQEQAPVETKTVEQTETPMETQTEVAVQEQPKPSVTERQNTSVKEFVEEQAEMGFEGIEVGAFSFDRIKLHEGQFLLGQEEVELGQNFEFIAMSTRNLYVVRQGDFNDAENFYSYSADGSTMTDGTSSQSKLDEWKGDGYGVEGEPLDIRKYLEIMAELITDDEHNGTIVNLSIPPSSLQRFGGVSMIAKARFRANINEVVIQASVGAKVGEGNKSFRPWNFKVSRKLA